MLGDDKGDDHFPGLLAQDPDSPPGLGSSQEIGIIRIYRGDHCLIIPPAVKVVFPEIKLLLLAVKDNAASFLAYNKPLPAADDFIGRESAFAG